MSIYLYGVNQSLMGHSLVKTALRRNPSAPPGLVGPGQNE